MAKANLYSFIHYPSAKAGGNDKGNDKDNENSNVKGNIKAGSNEKTLAKGNTRQDGITCQVKISLEQNIFNIGASGTLALLSA